MKITIYRCCECLEELDIKSRYFIHQLDPSSDAEYDEYRSTASRFTLDSTYDMMEDLYGRLPGYWDCKNHGAVKEAYQDGEVEAM